MELVIILIIVITAINAFICLCSEYTKNDYLYLKKIGLSFFLSKSLWKLELRMTVLTLNLWIVIITLLLSLILVNANNNCGDSTCDYCLEQSDFDDGTYIITQSGKYCLYEDIIFNPITIDINTPNKNTPYGYTGAVSQLGPL